MLGNDAVVRAPDRDAEAQRQAREGLVRHELDGVVVNLFHGREHSVRIAGNADARVVHDHVEREHDVVSVQILAVGPLDALTELDDVLGEILVGFRHALGDFAELLAGDGIHLPQVRRHQLMDAEAHLGAHHVAVKLAGNVRRRLRLDDERLVARRANIRHFLRKARHAERHQHAKHEKDGEDFAHKVTSFLFPRNTVRRFPNGSEQEFVSYEIRHKSGDPHFSCIGILEVQLSVSMLIS